MKKLEQMNPTELREYADKLEKQNLRPMPQKTVNINRLIRTTESVMDDLAKIGYSKDYQQYIFEDAMKCIYGEKVFDWINENDKGG